MAQKYFFFGLLYSPAYPLGTRLGVTIFWQPAVIQDYFLGNIARRSLIMCQWLLLWFYTQRIYLASLDIINITRDINALFISLSYLGVPRPLWRKKKRKFVRRRRKFPRRLLFKARAPRVFVKKHFQITSRFLFLIEKRNLGFFDKLWNRSGLLTKRSYPAFLHFSVSKRKFGNYFLRYSKTLNRLHMDLVKRFLTGFYNSVTIKDYKNYFGPKKRLKKKVWFFRKINFRPFGFFFRSTFNLIWYRQMWLLKFLTKRRKFFGRFLFRRLRRKTSSCRTKITQLRFFWYLKICFECYFSQKIALNCVNLYISYFQSGVITRLSLRDSPALNRYINALKVRRTTNITKFRRLARDFSFRPDKPLTINKFSYAQIVLFLGLHPSWRKLVNVYNLCFLVIGSALLKNIQLLSQWLYNMVSLGHTRRFRLMRMRFFMLVAKLLRDYAVFGQYLKGFRIEVYGKTGRSQKTRTRFFGDHAGLRFYRLAFRMNYQAFDVPTFAGVLGIRFWIY